MKLKIFFTFVLLISFTSLGQIRTKEQVSTIPKDKRVDEILRLDTIVNTLRDSINQVSIALRACGAKNAELSTELDKFKEGQKTSKIGDQYWMNTNLNVTKLNDGTPLTFAQSKEEWNECYANKKPAYCFHQADSTHSKGTLYNIHALNSGKLAPSGWVIPTVEDVQKMINSFGSVQTSAGLLLKSKDNKKWPHPGQDLFNMNIEPNGFRLDDGNDWYHGDKVYFYCEGKDKEKLLNFFVFSDFSEKVYFLNRNMETDNVNYGMYVRCLKVIKD